MVKVNSHVQVPKTVLKNFQDAKTGKVNFIELDDQKIHSKGIAKLGTEYGYYSSKTEEYLSERVEKALGDLINKLLSPVNKKEEAISLNIKDSELTVKRYFSALLYRSSLADEELKDNSYTAYQFPDQARHDLTIVTAMELNNGVLPGLDDYAFGVLINNSTVHFVIPRNGVYAFKSNGLNCYAAPISPVCALLLVPKEFEMLTSLGEPTKVGTISEDDDVMEMNIAALLMERIFNHTFVAADRYSELKSLLEYMSDKPDMLKKSER